MSQTQTLTAQVQLPRYEINRFGIVYPRTHYERAKKLQDCRARANQKKSDPNPIMSIVKTKTATKRATQKAKLGKRSNEQFTRRGFTPSPHQLAAERSSESEGEQTWNWENDRSSATDFEILDDGTRVWTIQAIRDMYRDVNTREPMMVIKWEGYPDAENTIEPLGNLGVTQANLEMLRRFRRSILTEIKFDLPAFGPGGNMRHPQSREALIESQAETIQMVEKAIRRMKLVLKQEADYEMEKDSDLQKKTPPREPKPNPKLEKLINRIDRITAPKNQRLKKRRPIPEPSPDTEEQQEAPVKEDPAIEEEAALAPGSRVSNFKIVIPADGGGDGDDDGEGNTKLEFEEKRSDEDSDSDDEDRTSESGDEEETSQSEGEAETSESEEEDSRRAVKSEAEEEEGGEVEGVEWGRSGN